MTRLLHLLIKFSVINQILMIRTYDIIAR